jgi:PAT family beta-lactamase induction signal transducer AmpG
MSVDAETSPAQLETSIPNDRFKWVVLLFLYVAQAIPSSFFDTAIPVLMRQKGISLASIGLLKWIALPVVLKFLWAPAVDRYGSASFGTYKTWIFPMQIITIFCTVALTRFDWLKDFRLFVIIALVWATAAATQDIGVDGLAVRSLRKDERAAGISLQNFSMLVGALVGGGAMVVTLSRIGFNNAILIITAVLALPLLALLAYKEPSAPMERTVVGMKSIVSIFKREGMLLWMAQIVLLIAGGALATPMATPMLVDQGVALEKFGVLYGLIFPIVGGLSSLLAPFVLRKFGRKRMIIGSACFICVDLINLILIDKLHPTLPIIFSVLAFSAFTNMFLLIGMSTVCMDLCRAETAATDWTVQMSILALAGPLFGGLGGFIAQALGYTPLFAIGIVLTIIGIFIVIRHLGDGYLIVDPKFE